MFSIKDIGSALSHFQTADVINAISVPWGPACATLVTYPAGMAEISPKDRLFIGPTDPSAREWLPDGHMAIGIPVNIARQMAKDVKKSFLAKNTR